MSKVCATVAAIAVMAYTFARVSAVAALKRGEYTLESKRGRCGSTKKGAKRNWFGCIAKQRDIWTPIWVPPGISDAKAPLFQTLDKKHRETGKALSRRDMLRAAEIRCRVIGLPDSICNHTFRGTGIMVFLQNGGSLEAAQDMANDADPRTTKLYNRRKDLATLSEIERRIAF